MLLDKINKLKKKSSPSSNEDIREINKLKKLKTDQKYQTTFESFKLYTFMIYDGLAFFGFAFNKLPRLRGHKESFMDKFRDRKKLATLFCFMLVAVVVVL